MKKIIIILLLPLISFSQADTEIYLFDLQKKGTEWKVLNGKNISNNKGYDSQPSFYDNNILLFSSNKNGQTDIAKYNIKTGKKTFISNTTYGSEYSPERIPNSNAISAVRLDKTGLQRFYKYNFKNGNSKELIKNLKVAYPRWHNKDTLVAVSIINDTLELFIHNFKINKSVSYAKKVGRSVHKIPNTNMMSFISKENKNWEVKSINLITKEIKTLIEIGQKEDICWLPNGTLLLAKNNAILKFDPKTDKKWKPFHTFTDKNINNISRIMVNKNSTKLVLVAE